MASILELANQVGATGVVVLDHGRELLSAATDGAIPLVPGRNLTSGPY